MELSLGAQILSNIQCGDGVSTATDWLGVAGDQASAVCDTIGSTVLVTDLPEPPCPGRRTSSSWNLLDPLEMKKRHGTFEVLSTGLRPQPAHLRPCVIRQNCTRLVGRDGCILRGRYHDSSHPFLL